MPAGCWPRAPIWAVVLVNGAVLISVLVVGVAVLAGPAVAHGFELACRVPGTPVSIMLTAP